MIYRPEQNQGRGKSESTESLNEFYRRKQSANINRVMGDGDLPLAPPDRDSEADNFSYGQKGWERPKDRGPTKSSDMWDEEAWQKKE
jgi:hypothetical protein